MENNSNSKGIGFLGLLQIVFITLKLCKVIGWNWLIVLLPTLIPTALVVLWFLFLLVAWVINTIAKKRSK